MPRGIGGPQQRGMTAELFGRLLCNVSCVRIIMLAG
jgi:hypothetical protein